MTDMTDNTNSNSFPPLPTVSEGLKQALALIDTYGWIQGDYGDTDRGFCLLGGMTYYIEMLESQERGRSDDDHYQWSMELWMVYEYMINALCNEINKVDETCRRSIPDFNDSSFTDFDDVRHLVKFAIETAELNEQNENKDKGNDEALDR